MTETATSPQLLRRVNAEALLRVMRGSDAMTGTELMSLTGLTRATVIAVCEDLAEAGWIRELENQREAGGYVKGRPARRFGFDRHAGYVLGIDLGASKTTVLVSDLLGVTCAKTTVPFRDWQIPATERVEVVDAAARSALADADVTPDSVLTVAVGLSAPVGRGGRVHRAQHFWRLFDVGLDTALADRYGWHVLIENDANLAAKAERWQGVAQGVDDLAVILASERMGAGILESGRLLRGSQGGVGELGFLGMLEGVGNTDGIATLARRWAKEAVAADARTILTELGRGSPGGLTSEMVFAAAADGDAVARDILDRLATRMARVVAALGSLLNPELVVISGAVSASARVLIDDITERLPGLTSTPPRVLTSSLGDSVVSIGAVRHALDYLEAHALDIRPIQR
jgi:predicted NBD/HSP70 family sugar kinase